MVVNCRNLPVFLSGPCRRSILTATNTNGKLKRLAPKDQR